MDNNIFSPDLTISEAGSDVPYMTNDFPHSFDPSILTTAFDTTSGQQTTLSGTPDSEWTDTLYKRTNTEILNEIEQFCRNSLEDVKTTNEKSPSLPAFMSIFALIGSLSNLAFNKHSSFESKKGKDGWIYKALIDRFVLGYSDTDKRSKVEKRRGLSDVLYKNIRCGLIHGGSLVSIGKNGTLRNERVKIVLSHVKKDSRDFKTLDKEIIGLKNNTDKHLEIIIGADAMYDAIAQIIQGMFHASEPEVLKSIRETYHEAPFVVELKN